MLPIAVRFRRCSSRLATWFDTTLPSGQVGWQNRLLVCVSINDNAFNRTDADAQRHLYQPAVQRAGKRTADQASIVRGSSKSRHRTPVAYTNRLIHITGHSRKINTYIGWILHGKLILYRSQNNVNVCFVNHFYLYFLIKLCPDSAGLSTWELVAPAPLSATHIKV